MAILEIGINYGVKNLVELKYYKTSDNILEPEIRARFLSGVRDFISEVYDDKMNVILFSKFQIVCYCKLIKVSDKKSSEPKLLIVYAITEKEIDSDLITKHLKEIVSQFLNMYNLDDIISKTPEDFKPFESHINKILGDLRFKIEDRIKTLFR